MEKTPVVVFDVDNTIIKGNLTFFFLKFLAKESLLFLIRLLPILLHAAMLITYQLPQIIKNKKNLQLDQSITNKITLFYKRLAHTLGALGLTNNALEQKAKELFTNDFFKQHLYPEAISKIKEHLQNQEAIVVLLSGSPQQLVKILKTHLLKTHLKQTDIQIERRFFARGTVLWPKVKACIGSKKLDALTKLLKEENHHEYVLQFIYSDNNYMADLPLLRKSTNGGALICKKHAAYLSLPQKLLKRFIFLPLWKRAS